MNVDIFNNLEIATIYTYLNDEIGQDENYPLHQLMKKFISGSYVEALNDEECLEVLNVTQCSSAPEQSAKTFSDFCQYTFSKYLNSNLLKGEQVLFCIGVSCLQLFVQNNFTGPLVDAPEIKLLSGLTSSYFTSGNFEDQILHEMTLDGESIYAEIIYPEYLLISNVIFTNLKKYFSNSITINWWHCRYAFIHQKILDEQSTILYEMLLESLHLVENNEKIMNETLCRDIPALFHLEAAHFHLQYYDVGKAKHHVENSLSILGMKISLTGALGVRTKWQQNQLAQLVVKVDYDGKSITEEEIVEPHLLPTDLPKDLNLNDDTRCDKIKFQDVDEGTIPNLRPIEQVAVFTYFLLKRKSQAVDEMLTEESKAFLMAVLQYPKNWCLQLNALLMRSKVESMEMRAMERSLNQLEELVHSVSREEPSRFERLKLVYSSPLLPHWSLEQELAKMFLRLGCTKTALELFEKLQLWEDVVMCYNELQMRQRSAEIIRQLLEKEETPRYWCLLGDATDDIDCYNKAWELSNHKSGRAQRCLGNFYYVRKNYSLALEHFEKSVQINSIQFPVWQRLAYCALQTENWSQCATAYKRCSVLEPDCFEAWNNMSQAYLKLGESFKAWKALQEALRCKMDNWRVWDNYMLVSTSLGYMNQALNAYNRILQYKEKHIDTEVLGRIVQAVIHEKVDPDGKPMSSLRKQCQELVGKLTRETQSNGELWFLNAELLYTMPGSSQETKHTSMQHYRKAVASDVQKNGWDKNTSLVCLVIARALKLIDVAKDVSQTSNPKSAVADLSSMRMLIRNIVMSVKKSQIDITTGETVDSVNKPLADLELALSEVNELVLKLSQN